MERGADELRPGLLRAQLEQIAAALGLGVGHCRLLLDFQDGHLHWFEPTMLRTKPDLLDELAARGALAGAIEEPQA